MVRVVGTTLLVALLVVCVVVVFGENERDNEDWMHPDKGKRSRLSRQSAQEEQQTYWRTNAQQLVQDRVELSKNLNTNKAKNVIMFLGDGMSLETVAATRKYMGDNNMELSFERFPYIGLSKTYCVNRQVADSACSATAYLSGVKANYGTIGVNAKVPRYDCEAGLNEDTFTESIAKWALNDCRATGVVTTSRITHASPAGVYAHTANRNWENDLEVESNNCDASKNTDIAKQLIRWDVGKQLKVILGGGRREFRNTTVTDEEGSSGYRTDGLDLIQEWKDERSKVGAANYIWNREQLNAIDVDKTDYLLGLFEANHCLYNLEIEQNNKQDTEPTLTEMTEMAIKMMSKEEEGYFLFVESARIDMGHHENWAYKALDETKEFSKAIARALELTSTEDTLIVVTSDHSHTMSYNGYPDRDESIFAFYMADDNLNFTTLSYANGPGYTNTYLETGGRKSPNDYDYTNIDHSFPAMVPLDSETHGGNDVGIFASGPWAHLFVGNYEQNNIPLLMAYAAKLGPYGEEDKICSSAPVGATFSVLFILLLALKAIYNYC